jgi:hypothetical protein
MITQQGNALTFYAFYTESKLGKTGLTVTLDLYEATTASPIVTAGSATELAGGLYYYTLASGSVDANGAYIAVFKTATDTVDQQHIPALWSVGNRVSADAVAISGSTSAADNVEASIASDGVVLSTATKQAIADTLLARGVDNVEGSAGIYTLAALVLAAFESSISDTTWTINRTDGSTEFATRTVTSNADAEPITGVS